MIEPTAARALAGALRLAAGGRDGLAAFEATPRGFWHSFTAALLGAPLLAVLKLAAMPGIVDRAASPARVVAAEAIGYVVGWVLFPLVMLRLADAIDRGGQVLLFLVAWNWANLVQATVQVPVALLVMTGLLPDLLADLVALAVIGWALWYEWFVARHGLAVTAGQAALIVLLDLLLGLLVSATALRLHA